MRALNAGLLSIWLLTTPINSAQSDLCLTAGFPYHAYGLDS